MSRRRCSRPATSAPTRSCSRRKCGRPCRSRRAARRRCPQVLGSSFLVPFGNATLCGQGEIRHPQRRLTHFVHHDVVRLLSHVKWYNSHKFVMSSGRELDVVLYNAVCGLADHHARHVLHNVLHKFCAVHFGGEAAAGLDTPALLQPCGVIRRRDVPLQAVVDQLRATGQADSPRPRLHVALDAQRPPVERDEIEHALERHLCLFPQLDDTRMRITVEVLPSLSCSQVDLDRGAISTEASSLLYRSCASSVATIMDYG